MPYKDPEKRKQYQKEYQKKYYLKNKQKLNEKHKKYREANEEKIKNHEKTPERIKQHRISNWKRYGIICDNFDALYFHFLKTSYCDLCKVELTTDKDITSTTKCLDHDHTITNRPNFRNILCQSCNVKRK